MLKLWPFYFLIFSLEAAEWNFKNNPFFKASKILETNLESLPQSFEISGLFGSDWIWPIKEGGILNRWALKNPKKTSDKYLFSFFTYESLRNVDLAQLSPTEKFDLYLGNFDWNFSKLVKKAQATLRESDFKTQLAFSESVLNFKNPSPLIVEGKNSLKIPFGSSDMSALLFASLLLDEKSETKIIGSPCQINFLKASDTEKCDGINPGTFHVLITNYLGLRDKGLIMDLKRDKNLELRPIIGFVSNFKTIEGRPPGNTKIKKEVLVSTFVKFIRPVLPKWSFEPATSSRGYESYTYILELDEKNNIKGGRWVSFNRPDFIVIKNSIPFQDHFKELETIYRKSTSLVFESDLKFKGFSQKEILMELISKGPAEIINSMFEEYFENYKNQLIQKKSIKKFARARLSRELNINQKNLLQKIKLIPVGPGFKKISSKFIQLAESNANPKDIKQIQKSFIDFARRNYRHSDLLNVGKISYLQQKYLDDFIDKPNLDYNRFDLLERGFLLESNVFSEKEILTANKSFLEGSLTFLKGARKQREDLKSNSTGQLKANKITPKINDVKNSPLVSSFINDVKAEIQRSKIRENKNWKRFLSEEKSISRNNLPFPNLQEEFKKYKTPRNYQGIKKLYRLSFSLKRIQAWKKVLKIPVYNTLKDKTDYYQQKFLFESNQAKIRDFFMPYSKFESISLCGRTCFKGPILNKESDNFLNFYRMEVVNYDKKGSKMIAAIKKKDLKGVEELLQKNSFSVYETSERQNILTFATLDGNNEIIKKILGKDLGDALNFEDKNGKNALTLGIIKKVDQEVLKLMVIKGIDFNARDNLGFYPRDYLKRTNSFDQYLEGLGAKLSKGP